MCSFGGSVQWRPDHTRHVETSVVYAERTLERGRSRVGSRVGCLGLRPCFVRHMPFSKLGHLNSPVVKHRVACPQVLGVQRHPATTQHRFEARSAVDDVHLCESCRLKEAIEAVMYPTTSGAGFKALRLYL